MKKDDRCPFLEEVVVRYCKAYPIKKMIPRSSLQRDGPCIGCPEQCAAYQEVASVTPYASSVKRQVLGETFRPAEVVRGFLFNSLVYYLPNHFWVKFEKKDSVKVGFDDFAVKLLGNMTQILLPKKVEGLDGVGIRFRNGQRLFNIPINCLGKVNRINQAVISNPEITFNDPYGKGWLFTTANSKLQKVNCKYGANARKWFEKEIDMLITELTAEISEKSEIEFSAPSAVKMKSISAADGGELITCALAERISENAFQRLLKIFLNIKSADTAKTEE